MFYVLYGPDAFGVHEAVVSLRARLASDDPMAELNEVRLDGRGLGVGALQAACDVLPFLGARRLVVVHGFLAQIAGRKNVADALLDYLPRLPDTTRLAFVEGDLAASHRVLKWAQARAAASGADDRGVFVRRFAAPKPDSIPAWLVRRAEARGGTIDDAAAGALAAALVRDGTVDLYLADNELEKLLVCAGDRPVQRDDVAALVTSTSQESIFRLMDALADRNGAVSARLLHRFTGGGETPLRLLSLIARQFRLLVHARALLDAGMPAASIAAPLGVPPFVAARLATQARRFAPAMLHDRLVRLLEIDTAIKSGRTHPLVALDLFVAETCRVDASAGLARH